MQKERQEELLRLFVLGCSPYTFMHMSSITAGTNVTAGASVGKQGKEGNATGYHVHFEVHAGQTTSLSTGTDHVLGSLSPYRLQDYIGELS